MECARFQRYDHMRLPPPNAANADCLSELLG